ncbi:tRNA lysidine(34) synthetase TilS [Spiroplasma tabanidicola]|uniref:tRNA(Ile)-lysidine synthase n=1 Tax=Spiroplasma tabanidicola TaxID=324079 RepID=A0A6I6C7H3_9MOLU|nr:tRNA lysidine(34) synthetase TilS [Spiroplasma tabanidicola]QGS51379.1 tRNA(Ile)-lysidine synthase [Spiroplasma tabanidicola]
MRICNKKKYIVGLSGGPDSIYLLDNLIKKVNVNKIIACHVNYNFRKDSTTDMLICKKYCEKNKIKLLIKNINIDYDNLKKNFEAWAREERYDFFLDQLEKNNFDKILIAHNMNDDIETYLMQKQKKALSSYFGIKKETFYKDKKVMRPIIDTKKSQILKYLKENNIDYATDSTNCDIKYFRNSIRATLNEDDFIKLLEEKNLKNLELNKINIEIKKILAGQLKQAHFNRDESFNQRLLFSFLEQKGFGQIFYSRKKNTLKETIKQIKSTKSFVRVKIENLLLIKDRQNIYCIDLFNYEVLDKQINDLTEKDLKNFEPSINLKDFDGSLIITNDWQKHKLDLLYNNKKLSEFYKKNKTSYYKRYFQPIIYDKKNKIIKNIMN